MLQPNQRIVSKKVSICDLAILVANATVFPISVFSKLMIISKA
ncbi:hypothetical protein [Lactobacillus sp.]|nr:hypothetical protein [Lactobacillus sp.]